MNRGLLIVGVVLAVLLGASVVVFVAEPGAASDRPVVVCTTTHLGAVVEALAGDAVDVEVFTPAGACPGHFALSPQAAQRAAAAAVVLGHGWEGYLSKLGAAGGAARPVVVDVKGNWFVESTQQQAARRVAEELVRRLPDLAPEVRRRLTRHLAEVHEAFAGARRPAFRDVPVVASFRLGDLLGALGFKVLATYGGRGELTPAELADAVARARAAGAGLVVDNRQSGATLGTAIVSELGWPPSRHVVLDNFPRAVNGRWRYADTLAANAARLADALAGASDAMEQP